MQKDDKALQNARKSKRGVFNLKGLMTLVIVATMMVGTAMPVLANPNSQVTGPVQVLQVDTSLNVPIQTGDGYGYELVEEAPEPTPIPWQWVPISVSNEVVNGFNAIRRTYALPPYVNPAVICTESISMFGQEFNFAYLVQQNTANETFKEVRYTVEVDTASNNMTDILYRLESELRFDRDGFAGTLSLDIHSIRTVPAGQTRHTSTITRQRTFPHLSAPDNAFIPRTIVDGGATFTLANVEWSTQGGGTAVDGQQMSSTFTATATYSRQVTQTRTTGYVTTAEYVGTVFRTVQGYTIFTAIFYGEPVVEIWLEDTITDYIPAAVDSAYASASEQGAQNVGVVSDAGNAQREAREPRDMGNAPMIALAVIGGLLALGLIGAGAFFFGKKLGENNVTVLSHHSPREIVKAGKVKMDVNSDEPEILLDEVVGSNPARTGVYTIEIAKSSAIKVAGKVVRVVLGDKEALQPIPRDVSSKFDFDVSFADEDADDDSGGAGII